MSSHSGHSETPSLPTTEELYDKETLFRLNTTFAIASNFGSAIPRIPRLPNYIHVNFEGRRSRKLDSYKNQIIDTIIGNRLSLIVAPAGHGKTTQVPQYLLDLSYLIKDKVRIICAVPTRLQAATVARKVAHERGENLTQTVGYHSLLETATGPFSTLLTYCTYEALLRALTFASNVLLATTTHIIIDELQEVDPFAELLVAFLAQILRRHPCLRVVVMSSLTIEVTSLRAYLGQIATTGFDSFIVRGEESPTSITYLPSLPISEIDKIEDELRNMRLLSRTTDGMSVDLEMLMTCISNLHNRKPNSETMLVFLPDFESIITLKRMMFFHPTKYLHLPTFAVYFLCSELKTREFRRMMTEHPAEKRKIILTTELGESCIPIKAGIVIDTGKVRQESEGKGSKIYWISQASANERASRADADDGISECYRMYTDDCYQNMQKFRTTGAKRFASSKFCLYAFCAAFKSKRIPIECLMRLNLMEYQDLWYTPVDDRGMFNPHDIEMPVTKLGLMIMQFPIEPRLSKALVYGVTFRCLDPVATVVAAMCLQEFYLPTDCPLSKGQLRKKKLNAASGQAAFSDHMEIITTYKHWEFMFCSGPSVPVNEKVFDTIHVFELVHGIRTNLIKQLRAAGYIHPRRPADFIELNKNSNNWPLVKAVLATAMKGNFVHAHPQEDEFVHYTGAIQVPIRFHWTSILSKTAFFKNFRRAWIMYNERIEGANDCFLKSCTAISKLSVVLFCNYRMTPEVPPDHVTPVMTEGDSSEEIYGVKFVIRRQFHIVDMILLYKALQDGIKALFQKQIEDPGCDYEQEDEDFMLVLLKWLEMDEDSLGLVIGPDQVDFGDEQGFLGGGDL